MGDQVTVMCPAKINLSLNITGKTEDDMHTLKMINQSVNLYDFLVIKQSEKTLISTRHPELPLDQTNSCFKALQAMRAVFGIEENFEIEIIKNIPLRAGLGGESTDAAGVILGLKELLNLKTTDEQLINIGGSIGADVPFCLKGGTCMVQGIGDKVEPLTIYPFHYLIVKPYFDTNTGAAFAAFDDSCPKFKEEELFVFGLNDLEIVSPKEIQIIKAFMRDNKARFANMTGSGSSVVGAFTNKKARAAALRALKDYYQSSCQYFEVEPCEGIEILKKSRLS